MIAQLEEIQHPQNRDIIRSWWRRAMASGPEKHWICQNVTIIITNGNQFVDNAMKLIDFSGMDFTINQRMI